MAKKTIAVTGATGHIGKVIVEKLKAQGHDVRPVSRSQGLDIHDLAALTRAFSSVDAVFLMIPPDLQAAETRKQQNEVGSKLAEAVKKSGVRRVVLLSSLAAHPPEGTGPILGLHDMEERLNGMPIAERVYLRPTHFMENLLHGVEMIAKSGMYGGDMRPDLPMAMIATRDIGAKAAEFLTEEPFHQPLVRELLGPRDYTMAEATRIVGAAIGKSDLKYVQFPYEEAKKAMVGMGLSPAFADSLVEMDRCFNEGKLHGTEPRSTQNTTPTTLEQFAQEVFRPAYEALMAGAR